jgi:hypothetical protein
MTEPDLMARSSQSGYSPNPEARQLGERLHREIIAGDLNAAEELRKLGDASERGDPPVEVATPYANSKQNLLRRILGKVGLGS